MVRNTLEHTGTHWRGLMGVGRCETFAFSFFYALFKDLELLIYLFKKSGNPLLVNA